MTEKAATYWLKPNLDLPPRSEQPVRHDGDAESVNVEDGPGPARNQLAEHVVPIAYRRQAPDT